MMHGLTNLKIRQDSSGQVIIPTHRHILDKELHSKQTSMSPAGLEPKIPVSEGLRLTPQITQPLGSAISDCVSTNKQDCTDYPVAVFKDFDTSPSQNKDVLIVHAEYLRKSTTSEINLT